MSSLAATCRARWPVSAGLRGRARPQGPLVRPLQSASRDNAGATATAASTPSSSSSPFARLRGVRVLRATDGQPIPLVETWPSDRGGRALVVFARSFGCPFCQATARELARDVLPRLREQEAENAPRLVFVGIGTAERARHFAERTGLPPDALFADPDNAAYNALGLEASLAAAFLSPQTPLAIARRAARPGGWGDLKEMLDGWQPWQPPQGVRQALNQGGAFLFDGAECVWSHRDAATAAHAEPGEMLERALGLAARQAAGGGGGGDCGCGEETAAGAA